MAQSFSRSRLARRLSLVGALSLAVGIVIAPATSADDRLDIRTLEPSVSGHATTRAALLVDSDGDYWSDWV